MLWLVPMICVVVTFSFGLVWLVVEFAVVCCGCGCVYGCGCVRDCFHSVYIYVFCCFVLGLFVWFVVVLVVLCGVVFVCLLLCSVSISVYGVSDGVCLFGLYFVCVLCCF